LTLPSSLAGKVPCFTDVVDPNAEPGNAPDMLIGRVIGKVIGARRGEFIRPEVDGEND